MMFTGPCDWPLNFLGRDTAPFDKLDEGIIEPGEPPSKAVQRAAVEHLWNWTGRVFGPCPVRVELCLDGCVPVTPSMWSVQYRPGFAAGVSAFGMNWVCGKSCGCGKGCTMVRLPGPIHTVESVMIDEEPFTEWAIVNSTYIERTDGGKWPQCGDEASIVIEYTRGLPVPVGGQIAAGLLAEEMAKALINDGSCQLPQRVQSITRQGVSMAILDSGEGLDSGEVGIWLIDSWIRSVRQKPTKGRVVSIDKAPPGQNRSRR